jgi:tryptophan-rich sensory protein
VIALNLKKWKPYAIGILATEAVGALSSFLTRDGVKIYNTQVMKPALSPPPLVFPIVWAILYALMGIGVTRVYLSRPSKPRTEAIRLYLIQLGFNFLWSIIYFNLQAYGFAFLWLVILWGLIVWMTLTFYEVDHLAAYLQIPYLLWVLFAGYLNYGVWMLNR